MVKLDAVEGAGNKTSYYDRVEVKAKTYEGELLTCTVYMEGSMHKTDESETNVPPSERYLDIMCEGAAHFGVSQDYINYLR